MGTKHSTVAENEKLVIIWSSGEREVALKMVFIYLHNALDKKWWKEITLVVWGPSAKLLAEDGMVRNFLKKNMDNGTKVLACRSCTDDYLVTEELEGLGIEVDYIGELLTEYIKGGRHVITF